ncbi:MAG TPA: prepilin-type N-terminal cleavage/methylation domain-containing protein [Candidatus Paceibacterota bacterium]|nr:prepilin-type N-terminal cleavage/methylation domain-containing protein [Verrucomicrobiota bacterium]HSA09320.1 prepilin-type N-terminal cleavage/methylation domain-containing protein [Candidatus Paceibacterota bacterium]
MKANTRDYGPRSERQRPRTVVAFTLLELLTVIAIMGILAAIALPAIRGLKPNVKVAGTRQLLDAVTRARQLAVSQRTPVYMVFLFTNFYSGLNGTNLARVQPLLDKQLTGYAFLTLRSVGDQPGVSTPRYLSSWKSLPAGAYIPVEKFLVGGLYLSNATMTPPAGPPVYIPPFPVTNNIPFPSEDNPVTVPVALPYIAFDGMGQLISGLPGQPELIPVAEGRVSFARDPNSKQALPQPPAVTEQPPGNTYDNFSLVYIDRLTGRARVERRKVQ